MAKFETSFIEFVEKIAAEYPHVGYVISVGNDILPKYCGEFWHEDYPDRRHSWSIDYSIVARVSKDVLEDFIRRQISAGILC